VKVICCEPECLGSVDTENRISASGPKGEAEGAPCSICGRLHNENGEGITLTGKRAFAVVRPGKPASLVVAE
jgi:hypothetical protein